MDTRTHTHTHTDYMYMYTHSSSDVGATASYQPFDSAPPTSRKPVRRQRTISSSIAPGTKLYKAYRIVQYLYIKLRQLTVASVRLLWRFLELHLHKVISLTIFAVAISQVSACYWVLLVALVVVVPLPLLNIVTYPLLTLYLGFLIATKMVYQVPMINSDWLEIENCTNEVCFLLFTCLFVVLVVVYLFGVVFKSFCCCLLVCCFCCLIVWGVCFCCCLLVCLLLLLLFTCLFNEWIGEHVHIRWLLGIINAHTHAHTHTHTHTHTRHQEV